MSCLREELDRYLRIRRSLGWDLRTTERVLWRFIAFAESQNAKHISTNLFLKWHGPAVRAVAARPRSSTCGAESLERPEKEQH
jgi:hypothetical protein